MRSVSRRLDRLRVVFDDENLVANAGLVLPATLAETLGIEAAANEFIRLGDVPGRFQPGRKLLTLVRAIAAGGDCIEDCDVLRAGASDAVTGHRVMALSTVGTFLRAFNPIHEPGPPLGATEFPAWPAG